MTGMRSATQFLVGFLTLSGVAFAQATVDLQSSEGRNVIDGLASGGRAGAWLHLGDLTGDYWNKELIVGSPDESGGRGTVRVYLGGNRAPADMTTASADVVLTGAAAADRFGAAVDAGYVTNAEVMLVNGNPSGPTPPRDLIVGAPGAAGGRGTVYLFPGPFPRNTSRTVANAVVQIVGAAPGDNLGNMIESADLNGDGYREVVLPVPARRLVYVLDIHNAPSSSIDLSSSIPGTVLTGLDNEIAVASGDLTGDGRVDLAIGAPTGFSNRGIVYFLESRARPLPESLPLNAQADAQLIGSDNGDRLGAALWVADLDDDAEFSAELLIGAPGGDGPGNSRTDAGEVHVVWGGPSLATVFRSGLVLYGAGTGHRLGTVVTAGYITRRSAYDAVMLAPGANGGKGEVFVYYGRHAYEFPDSSADMLSAASRRIISDEAAGSVRTLRVWEATGEGAEEIVMGVPDAQTSGGPAAGRVYIAISPRLELSSATATMRVARCVPALQRLEIRNPSSIAIPWLLRDAPAWAEMQPATGSVVVGTPAAVTLVARTADLAPGSYSQRVEVRSMGVHVGHALPISVQLTIDPASPLAANADVDFNGDGCGDAAVFSRSSATWHVPGSADQPLGAPGDVPVPGDYDGDRIAELAVYRPSDGTWTFQGGTTIQLGARGDMPVPGDYDGDGRLDVAVFTPATATWTVRGQAAVQFGARGDIPVPGDYNGDGRTEFAVYRRTTGEWLVQGMAPVTWGSVSDVPVPADYNADGRTDIAIFDRTTATWRVKDQFTRQFGEAGNIPAPFDADRDGAADLGVWRASDATWLVLSLATGVTSTYTSGAAGDIPAFMPKHLFFAANSDDMDGDSFSDFLLQHQSDGRLAAWSMNGTEMVQGSYLTPNRISDNRWKLVGTADFNGDARIDIVWQHSTSGQLAVWFMNGLQKTGDAPLNPRIMSDLNWQIRAVADFDGDGRPDLIWQHRQTGRVTYWLMDGLNKVRDGVIADTGSGSWGVAGAADFDGDGDQDLFFRNQSTGYLAIWQMRGTIMEDGYLVATPVKDQYWQIQAIMDLTGDGLADLIWQHLRDGRLAGWIMDGARFVNNFYLTPSNIGDLNWRIVAPR